MTPSAAASAGTTTFSTSETGETADAAVDGAVVGGTAAGGAGRLDAGHPLMDGRTADSPLITAYRGGRPSRRPVWFMRQAGRSLPEYLKVREGVAMLDSCLRPELASEITLQPVRRHDVDAAIFFSDIVIPLKLAGVGVDIVPGRRPGPGHAGAHGRGRAALPQLTERPWNPIREAVAADRRRAGQHPADRLRRRARSRSPRTWWKASRPATTCGPRTMMHADPEIWTALANWAADASGIPRDRVHQNRTGRRVRRRAGARYRPLGTIRSGLRAHRFSCRGTGRRSPCIPPYRLPRCPVAQRAENAAF